MTLARLVHNSPDSFPKLILSCILFKISLFKNICICFRSLSNLTITTEYVRATSSFHNQPRYDTVLVRMPDGNNVFARVHRIFQFLAAEQVWKVALVTLFRTLQSPSASRTGMRLVREDLDSSFIEVSWIV
jgi:hypothetical protein